MIGLKYNEIKEMTFTQIHNLIVATNEIFDSSSKRKPTQEEIDLIT